jgi:hypothetical protein
MKRIERAIPAGPAPIALALLLILTGRAPAAGPAPAARGRDLEDERVRAQLEQELVSAERTAVMLAELEGTLAFLAEEGGKRR